MAKEGGKKKRKKKKEKKRGKERNNETSHGKQKQSADSLYDRKPVGNPESEQMEAP